jgi:hypothetical protein
MFASHPKGMTMTKDTVHHPRTLVNTPTPQLHHTGPFRADLSCQRGDRLRSKRARFVVGLI